MRCVYKKNVLSPLRLSVTQNGRFFSSSQSPSLCKLLPLSLRTFSSRNFSSSRSHRRMDSSNATPSHSRERIPRVFSRVYHRICQVIFLLSSPLFSSPFDSFVLLLFDSAISIFDFFEMVGWEQIDSRGERVHRGREEEGSNFLPISKIFFVVVDFRRFGCCERWKTRFGLFFFELILIFTYVGLYDLRHWPKDRPVWSIL